MKVSPVVRVAGTTAKLAVKYGPQVKIAWDNGGRQGAAAAARRAQSLSARRKALRHAATLVAGAVLKVAPEGRSVYVVLSGDEPMAAYPAQERPLTELVEHADLDKRILPAD